SGASCKDWYSRLVRVPFSTTNVKQFRALRVVSMVMWTLDCSDTLLRSAFPSGTVRAPLASSEMGEDHAYLANPWGCFSRNDLPRCRLCALHRAWPQGLS